MFFIMTYIEPSTPISALDEGFLKDQGKLWGFKGSVHRKMPIHITINWNGESEDVLVKLKKD